MVHVQYLRVAFSSWRNGLCARIARVNSRVAGAGAVTMEGAAVTMEQLAAAAAAAGVDGAATTMATTRMQAAAAEAAAAETTTEGCSWLKAR